MLCSDLEYVSSISHDLKSPLNAIIGFVDLVKDGLLDQNHSPAPTVMENLEMVEMLSKEMLLLINNMLTASRIQAGKLPMMPVIVTKHEFRECAEMLEKVFQPEAKSRGIDFAVSVGALPDQIYWDVQQIRNFALNNLISNALKFVGENGIVRVHLDTDADGLVSILVADNGPGIPHGEREAIFNKFTQSTKTTRGYAGSGYGLFNALRVVKAHGGQLEIADGLENKGSTFVMKLPAMPFSIKPAAVA